MNIQHIGITFVLSPHLQISSLELCRSKASTAGAPAAADIVGSKPGVTCSLAEAAVCLCLKSEQNISAHHSILETGREIN